MKRILTAATIVLAGVGIVQSQDAEAQSGQGLAEAVGRGLVGSPAPALVVETIDGESIDLGELYGNKSVYLKFWATWCVPCREQMPHFEHVSETAGPELAVIGVNIGFNDSLADVRDVIDEDGLGMPMVIDDGRLAAAFDLRVTPQHVVIGRDSRIEYVGHLADDTLDAALSAARTPVPASRQQHDAGTPAGIVRYDVGDRLPKLSTVTIDGAGFDLIDNDERPTALVFMSPWCESYLATSRPAMATSCRQVREQVEALARTHTRVRWLGVASGLWATEGRLREYRAQHDIRIPLTLDATGEWFRSFAVRSVPTLLIADNGGVLVERVEGFDATLTTGLDSVLAH